MRVYDLDSVWRDQYEYDLQIRECEEYIREYNYNIKNRPPQVSESKQARVSGLQIAVALLDAYVGDILYK